MRDIKLLETCQHCGSNLTLVESLSYPEGELWLVKICLSCANFPVQEVVIIHKPNYKNVPVLFGKRVADHCGNCKSGEWLTNEDENQNGFCGQCGVKIDWETRIDIDNED